jgi:hypothetical protein
MIFAAAAPGRPSSGRRGALGRQSLSAADARSFHTQEAVKRKVQASRPPGRSSRIDALATVASKSASIR